MSKDFREGHIDDLTDITLTLNYNSEWFQLKNFSASSGAGQLSVANTGDSLEIAASQLVATGVGRDVYFLVGSFRFETNPDGGLPNDNDDAYPETVNDLQFTLNDSELTFKINGIVPAEQTASPTTQMRVVPYDVDDDSSITLVDLAYFIRQIGNNVNTTPSAYRFDFDQDGVVSLVDLAYLIRNVGINSSDGNSVRLPPLPQPLAAPLEFEEISVSAALNLSTVESVKPLAARGDASTMSTSYSSLEAEPVLPKPTLAPQSFDAANIDAAFGTLDSGDQNRTETLMARNERNYST